jgi:hypothetical protein
MSDELISRLARENPVPRELPMLPIEPVLVRLEEQPNAVIDGRAPNDLPDAVAPARRARLRLPRAGVAMAVVSMVVTLALGGLAIVVLHHRAATVQNQLPSVRPVPGPETVATLRSQLAILRRPQRASDRLPRWAAAAEERPDCSNCLNLAHMNERETRLLADISVRPPGAAHEVNERIYLVLGTPSATAQRHGQPVDGWRQASRLRRTVHLSIVGFTARVLGTSSPFDLLLNGSPQAMPAGALNPRDVMVGRAVTIGVIPDGITRVRWELANPGQKRAAIVYPKLRGNVAIAPWTPAPAATALLNQQWLVGATWYDAHGRAVASFHQSLAHLDQRP